MDSFTSMLIDMLETVSSTNPLDYQYHRNVFGNVADKDTDISFEFSTHRQYC